ncbi:hypothetical protein O1611_g6574 [Lasiodiplodia mahajangana]|uniref:Uncharacterized protein n=1 Tax=Lasiodiplodia mahajangana TaxID=1108764 RepID=A0ACC2JIL3_9PEZI|nr:hypothetical protein O1611_g6574 [Lasiodiplodia mahajangana]
MMLTLALAAGVLPSIAAALAGRLHDIARGDVGEPDISQFKCELPPLLDPSSDGLPAARDIFSSEEALKLQVKRHTTIVSIPSISYDDNGEPLEDPRWEVFYTLHDTLESLYPNVHRRMDLVKVNTFGLVYTIKGSDPTLKPLMLAAHQDVVPVPDDSLWSYPPFSGHFDGRWLWGRGASDDKNSLTALMSALEELLANPNWIPKRTIVFALGFDEECSGRRGAGTIGPYLESLYGPNSMALILDEGGMGLDLVGNETLYALPAVMEKGHVDIWIELYVNGGHSSTPFPHTGIGIVSEIVTRLEAHPWKPKLIEGSPIHKHFICQSEYSPDSAPKITKLIKKGNLKGLAKELATIDRSTHYRLQTSQAVDYFLGGVKINAMPEYIKIGVNHRIAPQDSIPAVKANILKQIKPIVKKFSLTVKAFEGEENNPSFEFDERFDDGVIAPLYKVEYNGTLILTSSQQTQVTPISPTTGPVWDVFSGTIQHSFAFDEGKVVPVGELMTGNTDTRHYLNLTPNIYRWIPIRKGLALNAHTVDERVDMVNHMEILSFYYDLIRNFDASKAASIVETVETSESEKIGELTWGVARPYKPSLKPILPYLIPRTHVRTIFTFRAITQYIDLPEWYKDAEGLPFRREDLTQREANKIFPSNLPAARANLLLKIIHGRRVAGTLDDPTLSRNTTEFRIADQKRALAYLREHIPVDEVLNAGLRAEDELNAIEQQDNTVDEANCDSKETSSRDAEAEAAEAPTGRLPKKPGSGSPYGESNFDRIRAANIAKRKAEEARLEEEQKLREEELAKENIGTLQTEQAKPKELSAFRQKYMERATDNLKAPPEMTIWQRLFPSFTMVLAVVAGSICFAMLYQASPASRRLFPDIPPAAATCLGLIAANFAIYALWKFPPAWPIFNRYMLLDAAVPRPLQILGAMFSHQALGHLLANMTFLWFFGTRVHDEIGRGNFLALYFASGALGFAASLTHFVLRLGLHCTTHGASGAVYGVITAFFWMHKFDEFKVLGYPPDPTRGPQGLGFIGLLIGAHLLPLVSKRGHNLDLASHFAGMATGALGIDIARQYMDYKARVRAERLKSMGMLNTVTEKREISPIVVDASLSSSKR